MTKELLEFDQIMDQEQKGIRREKFDLSSTRIVIDRLLREKLIRPDDTISHLRVLVEEEFKRIEDV